MCRRSGFSIKKKGLWLILVGAANSVMAESMYQGEDFFDLSFEQLLNVQIESATKTSTNISDVPAPITTFSRAEINGLGVRYLHELLEYVPGYQISRFATYQQQFTVTSRSLSGGASAKKILFLLDGRPMNDPRTGGDANLHNFSVEHIERVEVIRGPGSAIYGSNAFTGVVNIIPRAASKRVKVQAGNEIDYDFFAQWHHSLGDIEAQLQFNAIESKGGEYTLPDTFSDDLIKTRDPYSQHSMLLSLESKNTKLTLQKRYLNSDEFYSVQRVSNQYNNTLHQLWTASLEHSFQFWQHTNTKVSLDYVDSAIESSSQSTPVGAFANISDPASNDPLFGTGILDAARFQIDVFNDVTLSTNESLQYGISWHINEEVRAEGFTNFDIIALQSGAFPIKHYPNLDVPTAIGTEESQQAASALVQYQKYSGNWYWILGGRYDYYQDIGSRFTPRLGANYSLTEQWQLKFLYGEAFRAPDLSETGLRNGVTRIGNPDLDHETIKTYDFIIQYADEKLIASVNFYFNSFSKPIISGSLNNSQSFLNGDNTESHGVESEIKYSVSEDTWLRVAATHVFELPKQTIKQSRQLLNLHLNHKIGEVRLGLSALYHSERETMVSATERKKLDGDWFWRGHMKYLYSEKLTFNLLINNIDDQQHYGPAIGITLPNGVPHPGRQITLSATYDF